MGWDESAGEILPLSKRGCRARSRTGPACPAAFCPVFGGAFTVRFVIFSASSQTSNNTSAGGAAQVRAESVVPMCRPDLIEAPHPLRTPADLRHHVLLHDDSLRFDRAAPDWPMWLKAAGAKDVDTSRGPHFSHPDHAMQAAMNGAGIVLGWRTLAAADLAAGRLGIPFELTLPMELTFFFVCPHVAAERPKIVAFRD